MSIARLAFDARQRARRMGMSALAGAFIATGGAFLVSALWIVLAREFGSGVASLALGVVFICGGGVVLALERSRHATPPPDVMAARRSAAPPGRSGQLALLAEGLMLGATLFLQLRGRRR